MIKMTVAELKAKKKYPVCCDDSKWIKPRKGGGWRCLECGTIFDDYGRPIGGYNNETMNRFPEGHRLNYNKPRFAS